MCLSPNRCVLCKSDNESIDHHSSSVLQLNISRTRLILYKIYTTFQLLLTTFETIFQPSTQKPKHVLFHLILWLRFYGVIWLERNKRIFNDCSQTPIKLWDICNYPCLWTSKSKFFFFFVNYSPTDISLNINALL